MRRGKDIFMHVCPRILWI